MTFAVANATGSDVFSVFEQDIDLVIDVINYLIARGKKNTKKPHKSPSKSYGNGKFKEDDFWKYC